MKTAGNKSRLHVLLLCLVVLVVVVLSACGANAAPEVVAAGDEYADWPEKFVMGYFAGDDPNKVLETNEEFRVYMQESLGIPVEMITGTSYSAVIEAMRVDKVDSMEVGPFSYTLAVQEAGAEALAVNVAAEHDTYDPDLPPYYFSIIFTKKGSGIASLEDLRGKDFNFVDPASTSGHLMPKTLLIKNGIDPDEDMNTVFAGSHPTSVLSVWNDKSPAGATYEQNMHDLADEGQVEYCTFPDGQPSKLRTAEEIKANYEACPEGKLVAIAYSDPIPSTPFAIRSDLPQSFKDAVKAALLEITDHPDLIAQTGQWYVDPTAEMGLENLDAFYDPLRDVAKLLDLDLKSMD
ncbi:MAG: phosphate/phosphite/phosphonate ABC transporter substrate-binding protein [Anaerolineae bacterium]|nr:phosphate/phosphite/phosphonate ABC transporter substrate-binding protein [Anaerolineae bacterium]